MIGNRKSPGPERGAQVRQTGFVYAFRYGDGDHVKIGRTRDLTKRTNSLQGAHHNRLVVAASIEHEDYVAGEKYIHGLLVSRRAQEPGSSSREHFAVKDRELAEAFELTGTYLDVQLPQERQLKEHGYEALQAGESILPATDEDRQVKDSLGEVRARQAQLQPEFDRLDAEVEEVLGRQAPKRARLNGERAKLDAEERRLVTCTKLAIGPAAGIDGVASWESVADRSPQFDEESFRAAEPKLFEAYRRNAVDRTRLKLEQRAVYEAYRVVKTHREFRWVDDDNRSGDTDASEVPSGRWRRVVPRTMRKQIGLRKR